MALLGLGKFVCIHPNQTVHSKCVQHTSKRLTQFVFLVTVQAQGRVIFGCAMVARWTGDGNLDARSKIDTVFMTINCVFLGSRFKISIAGPSMCNGKMMLLKLHAFLACATARRCSSSSMHCLNSMEKERTLSSVCFLESDFRI